MNTTMNSDKISKKHTLHSETSVKQARIIGCIVSILAGALPSEGAYIAGLDAVSATSTFQGMVGMSLAGQGSLGWSTIEGSARIFGGGDSSLVGTTSWDNYKVRYSPTVPVSFLPNTLHTLTFSMGYVADWPKGNSGYLFSLGTIDGGTYAALASKSGFSAYRGNMHSNYSAVERVEMAFTTSSSVPSGPLSIEWEQTSAIAQWEKSNFFGFNLVTLDASAASPVPEPGGVVLPMIAFGVLMSLRRGRYGRCS
jgi:hypothetical protein